MTVTQHLESFKPETKLKITKSAQCKGHYLFSLDFSSPHIWSLFSPRDWIGFPCTMNCFGWSQGYFQKLSYARSNCCSSWWACLNLVPVKLHWVFVSYPCKEKVETFLPHLTLFIAKLGSTKDYEQPVIFKEHYRIWQNSLENLLN